MSQCFPKQFVRFRGKFKVELNLSNYATKADLKGATGTDTSKISRKIKFSQFKICSR